MVVIREGVRDPGTLLVPTTGICLVPSLGSRRVVTDTLDPFGELRRLDGEELDVHRAIHCTTGTTGCASSLNWCVDSDHPYLSVSPPVREDGRNETVAYPESLPLRPLTP